MQEPIGGSSAAQQLRFNMANTKQVVQDLNLVNPISGSMQKTRRGIGSSLTYLEPIRNSLQNPKRGRSVLVKNKPISMLKTWAYF